MLVILAGYRDKMSTLMRADPGLPRRFPVKHHLSDYSPQQLTLIATDRAMRAYGMTLEEGAGPKLTEAFATILAPEVP